MRGAWIEIFFPPGSVPGLMSLPVRGAWIEMSPRGGVRVLCSCRSPCGERGLKLLLFRALRRAYIVAPRAGSVD